jgi:hypothetical protein
MIVNGTYDDIVAAYEKNGYRFFDGNKPWNLNIFGIREVTDTNDFDDYICLAYRDDDGSPIVRMYNATTDPGKYWLEHPMNTKGTAILVPGQYRSSHQIAKHQGKYEALCQRGKVQVYRDDDKDTEHDLDPETIDEGYFGINIHRSNPYTESYYVNKWSAGCQVFRTVDDFNEFMDICRKAAEVYGNSFTYTLFDKKDFE